MGVPYGRSLSPVDSFIWVNMIHRQDLNDLYGEQAHTKTGSGK